MRPFLLQNGNKHKIQLVHIGALVFQSLFGLGALDDGVYDEVPNSYEAEQVMLEGFKIPWP